jgi:hypothetical protein
VMLVSKQLTYYPSRVIFVFYKVIDEKRGLN